MVAVLKEQNNEQFNSALEQGFDAKAIESKASMVFDCTLKLFQVRNMKKRTPQMQREHFPYDIFRFLRFKKIKINKMRNELKII